MKKRSVAFGLCLTCLVLMGLGCHRTPQITPSPIRQTQNATSSAATILFSTEAATKYCNGSEMNSEGYRKTITAPRTTDLPTYTNETQRAKFILLAATSGMCRQALENATITIQHNELHISPIESWAGISIGMCSCKPQVEVNAQRFPGITRVVWE